MDLFLRNFVTFLATALWLLIIGRVLASWVDPMARNPISAFLFQVTEPLLAPIRRALPQSGMIDFSPLILLLVLGVIVRAIL